MTIINEVTLYRRNSNKTVSFWNGIRRGNQVVRRWGILDGKIQSTFNNFGPIQNKSPLRVATECFERLIKGRIESGFVYDLGEVRETNEVQSSDMGFESLPLSFAPQKPIQAPPAPGCTKTRIILRKRDGQRHYVLVTPSGRIRLYSCKMKDVTTKFPLTLSALAKLKLPTCTVLDGEIICDRNGKDDFRSTNKVCRALPAEAAKNEAALPIRYMVFDLLYYKELDAYKWNYQSRYNLLTHQIPFSKANRSNRVYLAKSWDRMEDAVNAAKRLGWEGLVLWDADAPNQLRMDGKFARHGSNKWKPVKEGDFIALGWLPGSGKNSKIMGKLRIAEFQWDKKLKTWVIVEICNVGGGFKQIERTEAMTWEYPCVVQLEYNLQQPDTRALREPVFIRKRPDKTIEDMRRDCEMTAKAYFQI